MNTWIWIGLLQALSIILLVAEVFLPSGGILLGLTLATTGGSVWFAFDVSSVAGWSVLAANLIVLPLVGWRALEHVPNTPAALQDKLDGTAIDDRLQAYVGKDGVCETDLRPVGRVRIGPDILEAQMAHGFLARGRTVRVARLQAGHLFVEPL